MVIKIKYIKLNIFNMIQHNLKFTHNKKNNGEATHKISKKFCVKDFDYVFGQMKMNNNEDCSSKKKCAVIKV